MKIILPLLGPILGAAQWAVVEDHWKAAQFEDTFRSAVKCRDDPRCLNILGVFYFLGLSPVSTNMSHSFTCWFEASELGSIDAQFHLGLLLMHYDFDVTTSKETHLVYLEGQPPLRTSRNPKDLYHNRLALGMAKSSMYLYAAAMGDHVGAQIACAYREATCEGSVAYYMPVVRNDVQEYTKSIPRGYEKIRLSLTDLHTNHFATRNHQRELQIQYADRGSAGAQYATGRRFMLGIDGYEVDYVKAKMLFEASYNGGVIEARSFLGYFAALGLAGPRNLDAAGDHFASVLNKTNDPMSHNGMGYVCFMGSPSYPRDVDMAFLHFNESAYAGFPDGRYNVAMMFLGGFGNEGSVQAGLHHLARATEAGHQGATYALALYQSQTLAFVPNCWDSLQLIRRVAEKTSYVSKTLQQIYTLEDMAVQDTKQLIGYMYWILAEMGIEVAQNNLAVLLDRGSVTLFDADERVVASTFLRASSSQGNPEAEIRLVELALAGEGLQEHKTSRPLYGIQDSSGESLHEWLNVDRLSYSARHAPEYDTAFRSLLKLRRKVEEVDAPKRIQGKVEFLLGKMYHHGHGVSRDFQLAQHHYNRAVEIDRYYSKAPVFMATLLLNFENFVSRHQIITDLLRDIFSSWKALLVTLHVLALGTLLTCRAVLKVFAAP